ncbi:DUF2721 domain-containing protein [Rhodocyclus purpureus]|uniref:DUF2721 domain-containing protein n=1 Tax=Rhodocyclus purpureus TaxID=1067 RepID=UPI0019137D46|nr:DUF2721 domain-containing protein [Rhodocyclus purpureus]MBK5913348.1 hypothetical protein [Rhodocyclus purpureus]
MDANYPGVAQVIEMAVAPVFLLTGVGSILGVLVNRLARIVDRRRQLQGRAAGKGAAADSEEIRTLRQRKRWIQGAISLCVLSALLVSLVVVALFVGAEMHLNSDRVVAGLFVAALLALIGGLVAFLREISLAVARPESGEDRSC